MKKNYFPMMLAGGIVLLASCASEPRQEEVVNYPAISVTYPETTMDTTISDDYHGTIIADPYRWLEYDTAANVKEWVEAQNKVTFGYLDQIPFREQIKERLTEVLNYPRYSTPYRAGEY